MLSTASQDTITIVTEFGKFRYNNILMVMCALGDIFQDKVDKIIGDIEFVNTYTVSILVLSKESFYNHIYYIRVIFSGMLTTGLKFNSPRHRFLSKDIPYLGCVINQDGIKHYMTTVQCIMYLGRPNTTSEA